MLIPHICYYGSLSSLEVDSFPRILSFQFCTLDVLISENKKGYIILNRSSHRTCSVKKLLLKFVQHSPETPVLECLFNKIVPLNACNFIKKRLKHTRFPVNFAKFLRTAILINIWQGLLLIQRYCYYADLKLSLYVLSVVFIKNTMLKLLHC